MTVPAPATFAMAVAVKPISANARPRQSRWYTHRLQNAARALDGTPLTGPLYVRIIWFQKERTAGDIDNIAKRILDALKVIVLRDDDDIDRCLTQRSIAEVGGTFRIDPTRIPSQAIVTALQAMLDAEAHAIYVEIGSISNQTTGFGPVV